MTFLEIVNAVLHNLFDEEDRANAKRWVNYRYAWLLAVEEWAFLNGTATVGVTAGSMVVADAPDDFGIALALFNADGEPLDAIADFRLFLDRYQGAEAGTPEAFTAIGSQILVGPKAATTETGWLLPYEKDATPLENDNDVPVIPELFHSALADAGRAQGMMENHNPSWQAMDQNFVQAIDAMRRKYLVKVRGAGDQYGAYRPC